MFLYFAELPRDTIEFLAADELRSILLAAAVTVGRCFLTTWTHYWGLSRVRGLRHVQNSRAICPLLESRVCPVVPRTERIAKAQFGQPGCDAVFPLHEGREGRPGRCELRGRLQGLCHGSGGSVSIAEPGDACHLSRHRQTGSRKEVVIFMHKLVICVRSSVRDCTERKIVNLIKTAL